MMKGLFSTPPEPLSQVAFNLALDNFIAIERPHGHHEGSLWAAVNAEIRNQQMISGYKEHLIQQARPGKYLLVLDLATAEPTNKSAQWLLNRLGDLTDVHPARKNYQEHDIAKGFTSTQLLILYNLHTLRTKRGQVQYSGLEVLLALFRNDPVAMLLLPDDEATRETLVHHRLAMSYDRIDLNWYRNESPLVVNRLSQD